jgi:hypothetical protein
MPYAHARQILNEQLAAGVSCAPLQANVLKKFGYETANMLMKGCSHLLDQLAKNKWRKVA